MNLQKRIDALEKQSAKKSDGCNLIIFKIRYGGCPKPEEPTQKQVEDYLKKTGLCQRCTGNCSLLWDRKDLNDPDNYQFTNGHTIGEAGSAKSRDMNTLVPLNRHIYEVINPETRTLLEQLGNGRQPI
ncbi:MAG: hypothetical protein JRN22_00435 [Nitrososphaerota archaeon]|nr:hypothetical protein [Nitrososphaerota archaeon]